VDSHVPFRLYLTFQWKDFLGGGELYLALSTLYLGFDWRNFHENLYSHTLCMRDKLYGLVVISKKNLQFT
jgi:hypothetical protein